MSPRFKRQKSHHYGEIYLSDSARALLGDQYIENVYNLVSEAEHSSSRQRQILKTLAFMDMNVRRNQLESRRIHNVEWIWGSTLAFTDVPLSDNETNMDGLLKHYRQRLSREWEFDAADETIWHAVSSNIGRDMLKDFATASDPGFVKWLQSNEPIFWISGKPAGGKSSLVSYLSSHEKSQSILGQRRDGEWQLLHFFFDFRAETSLSNSVEGMFRSLLFQVVDRIPQMAAHIAGNPSTANMDIKYNSMSPALIARLIQSSIRAVYTRVCVFVDGLDEYLGCFSDLIDVLLSIADGFWIKICLASRPTPELSHRLGKFSGFKMQDHNHHTIASYARSTFDEVTQLEICSVNVWTLISRIVADSVGVILWCTLICADIRKGLYALESTEELLLRINQYPHDLDQVYSRLLSKVEPNFLAEGLIVFSLLQTYYEAHYTSDPLLEDLCHACEVCKECGILPACPIRCLDPKVFAARLLSRFGGLIDIVSVPSYGSFLHTVRLTHKTLSSFLDGSKYMNHPAVEKFRTRFPDFAWLRLYCEYLSLPEYGPLANELGVPISGKAHQNVQLQPRKDHLICRSFIRHHDQHEAVLDYLSPQFGEQYTMLMTTVSYFLSRTWWFRATDRSEGFPISPDLCQRIRQVLMSLPIRIRYCVYDGYSRPVPYRIAFQTSESDLAFYVCIGNGLWCLATELFDLSTQSQYLSAEAGYALTQQRRMPPIRLLDQVIKSLCQSIDLTRLFSQMFQLYAVFYVAPLVKRIMAFCSLTGLRDDKGLPPSELVHEFYTVPKANAHPANRSSFTELWTSVFLTPFPLWAESFGITRLFLWVVYSIMHYHDESTWLLEWIDIFLTTGDSLNTFCYPGGTILHLIVESFPFSKNMTVEIVEGLIERNIDVQLEGSNGTALDIITKFPTSRNSLFELHPDWISELGDDLSTTPFSWIPHLDEEREVAAALQSLLEQATIKQKSGQTKPYKPPTPEFWLQRTAQSLYDMDEHGAKDENPSE